MSAEALRRTRALPLEVMHFASWPRVPPGAIPAGRRESFERRLMACELYFGQNLSASAVARRVGLSASQVLRLARAALRGHPDGEIYGQRALVPYLHRERYERTSGGTLGTAGLFAQLLKRFPDVEAQITYDYCRLGKRLTDIHGRMLSALAARGITAHEYPFNTSSEAAVSLRAFCKSLEGQRFRQIAHARFGKEAARSADMTEPDRVSRLILRPYNRVEIDAHTVDAVFVLKVPTGDRTHRLVTLRRLLIIVVLDVASRAVLGHALSLNKTESRQDILAAIERALTDSRPLPITEPGLACRNDSGLPVHRLPHCAFRLIDEFAFDNSLAASSPGLQLTLIEHLQARVNLGKCASPEGRAFVESFFKKLTQNGIQKLPSTTGGSPESPKRRRPEEKAHRFSLTLETAEQILEVIIGEYNNTVHGSLGCTPLQYIRSWDASGGLARYLPQALRGLDFLYEQPLRLTVRGSLRSGTRPYVQFAGARYRNAQLAQHVTSIGSKIVGILDRRNVALIRAFLPSGEPLGVLKAQGRWGLTPHSLKTRRAILTRERAGDLASFSPDPVDNFTTALIQEAGGARAMANELARVNRERQSERDRTGVGAPQRRSAPHAAAESSADAAPSMTPVPRQASDGTDPPLRSASRSEAAPQATGPEDIPDLELSLGEDLTIQRKERR